MSKKLIIIHGLLNKPEPDVLADGWKDAMLEGLKINCGVECEELPIQQAYWADKMYPDYDENPDLYKPAKEGALKRYKESWFDVIKKEVFDMTDDFVDIVRDVVGMGPLSKLVLKNHLSDLYRYYSETNKRQQLRGILRSILLQNKGKRLFIVAHSMGSIIAYDTLREIGREDASIVVEHFITIGSPLGLPLVKGMIHKENALVRTPSNVRKWTNHADRRDPVAFDTHLSGEYEPNDRGVQVVDDLVLNDWGGISHKSYGYLRTPEFSDLLRTFI